MDKEEEREAINQHNEWSELYRRDPEAFEKKRQEMVEETIRSAPPYMQLKLRALQARFEKRMRTAGCKENRLVIAHSMLMEMFLEQFNPALQQAAGSLKKLWSSKTDEDPILSK